MISVFILDVGKEEDTTKLKQAGMIVFSYIGLLDHILSLLTMYLHYGFAINLYNKFCWKCHDKAKQKYDKRAGSSMKIRAISLHTATSHELSIGSSGLDEKQSKTAEDI